MHRQRWAASGSPKKALLWSYLSRCIILVRIKCVKWYWQNHIAPAKIYRPCASRLSTTNSIGLYTVVMISSQDFELNFFNLSSLLFNFQVSVAFRFNLLCKSHSNFLRTLIKFPISICNQNKKARTLFSFTIFTKGYSYPVVTKIVPEICTSLKL